jgi:hypothetical protein
MLSGRVETAGVHGIVRRCQMRIQDIHLRSNVVER